MKSIKYILTLLTAAMLAACSDSALTPVDTGNGSSGTITKSAKTLGLVKVTISGIGTEKMTATAEPAKPGMVMPPAAANLTRPGGPSTDHSIQMEAISNGSYTDGVRGSGGMRYLWATFKIRNADEAKQPYSNDRENLTFLAASVDNGANETYGETPIQLFRLFDGTELTGTQAETIANGMVPTGRASMNKSGAFKQVDVGVLQVFEESELSSIANVPSGVHLFPYGFVVDNPNNPNSRKLSGNPLANQFDGRVTFAFKIPLQAQANQDPFEIEAIFLAFDDSETRMTQSLETQDAAYNAAISARAKALDVDYVTVFPGSEYVGARQVVCDPVRITGQTPGSPDNTLFLPAPSINSVSPAPYSSGSHKISNPVQFKATFSSSLNSADVKSNTFVVRGKQSGQKFVNQNYSTPFGQQAKTPSANFFPGEMIEVSLTTGLGICPDQMYRYRVKTTAGTGTFGSATTFSTGDQPMSVALGDLNGDGKLDMVTANRISGDISVRLGDGTGGFGSEITYSAGDRPNSVALGDLNGDGNLDVIVTNRNDNNVSVRLGTGNGEFNSETTYSVGGSPTTVKLTDLNGDGALDMVVLTTPTKIRIRLGDGTGGFGTETTVSAFATGSGFSVALGDLNGDGVIDMVNTAHRTNDKVNVRLGDGNGSGGFYNFTPFPVGGDRAIGIALGDLNGDGHLDIVTLNRMSKDVSVLQGDGTGGFGTASTYSVGVMGTEVALGDLDGDGNLDIVVTNQDDDNISVLRGYGDGSFRSQTTYSAGTKPYSVALGDLNGNGALDVVVSNWKSKRVSVLMNQ